MKKYIYQKFLLQCDYNKVDLGDIPRFQGSLEDLSTLGEEYNIFDIGTIFTRKISLSELDQKIDTVEEWNDFVANVTPVDRLVLYNDVGISKNRIIAEYRLATLKAYLYRLKNDCKNVLIFYNENSNGSA